MSYSALCGSGTDGRIRCKLTDANFASGLKITDVGNQSQTFVQTPLNELLLEQRNSAGTLLNTTNLTTLSSTGIPVFGGVAIDDPSLTGQTELTADATGSLYVSKTAPAPLSAQGGGTIYHGTAQISDPTGVGRVELAVSAGGDLTFERVLPAPTASFSLFDIATNAIGPQVAAPRGALLGAGTLVLNGGGGAQAVALPTITATSTIVVSVAQHLAAVNTANYAVSVPNAGVGFTITSTGATDVDSVSWMVFNT